MQKRVVGYFEQFTDRCPDPLLMEGGEQTQCYLLSKRYGKYLDFVPVSSENMHNQPMDACIIEVVDERDIFRIAGLRRSGFAVIAITNDEISNFDLIADIADAGANLTLNLREFNRYDLVAIVDSVIEDALAAVP